MSQEGEMLNLCSLNLIIHIDAIAIFGYFSSLWNKHDKDEISWVSHSIDKDTCLMITDTLEVHVPYIDIVPFSFNFLPF